MRQGFTFLCLVLFMAPLTGSIGNDVDNEEGWTTVIPEMTPVVYEEVDWWDRTTLDSNRNGIHDSLETIDQPVGVGLSYSRDVTDFDVAYLESLG